MAESLRVVSAIQPFSAFSDPLLSSGGTSERGNNSIKEVPVVDARTARRARLSTPDDDHHFGLGIDVEVLPEDPLPPVRAVFLRGDGRRRPPEVAIGQRPSTRQHLRARR